MLMLCTTAYYVANMFDFWSYMCLISLIRLCKCVGSGSTELGGGMTRWSPVYRLVGVAVSPIVVVVVVVSFVCCCCCCCCCLLSANISQSYG